uniref:Uncharacterized protein n=1 Tax=Romanomermis culicivorax TaxID=13658 RepID=A0A915HGL7_ROMCU
MSDDDGGGNFACLKVLYIRWRVPNTAKRTTVKLKAAILKRGNLNTANMYLVANEPIEYFVFSNETKVVFCFVSLRNETGIKSRFSFK